MTFQLAACAEMLWQDKPIHWRAARLHEMGFGVGLWNWPAWDLDALERTGANFTIMNGYLQGRLADAEGADMLLASAREAAQVGKRLGVARLNLHGTGLGDMGVPIPHIGAIAPGAEQRARDTLHRICDIAEAEGVVGKRKEQPSDGDSRDDLSRERAQLSRPNPSSRLPSRPTTSGMSQGFDDQLVTKETTRVGIGIRGRPQCVEARIKIGKPLFKAADDAFERRARNEK